MTTFQSIAGGVAWAFTAILLVSAALEPVSVTDAAKAPPLEIAAAAAAAESRS